MLNQNLEASPILIRDVGYVNQIEIPTSKDNVFVKGKEEITSQVTSFNTFFL